MIVQGPMRLHILAFRTSGAALRFPCEQGTLRSISMTRIPVLSTSEEVEKYFPIVGAFHRYWEALAVGKAPERHLVDPSKIRQLLPNLMVVEFESNPFRVRYRLTGTLVDFATGFNLTGHYLDEYVVEPIAADIRRIIDAYERVYRSAVPYIGVYTWAGKARPMQVGYGIFPVLVNGHLRQAIVVEEEWHPDPHEEIATWKDAIDSGALKSAT